MSYIVQWIIVGIVIAGAVIYLVRHLRPPKNGCCCSGCPYAGSCSAAAKDKGECAES